MSTFKFLHTADWHLGKSFYANSLIADQEHVLGQFLALAEQTNPDAVVLAGDVYDRAVPSPEAVRLLDWVLTSLIEKLKIPTFIIAGNHDSADRIHFGSQILRNQGLYVCGRLDGCPSPIKVDSRFSSGASVWFCPLPYCEPAEARALLENDAIESHNEAMAGLVSLYREQLPPKAHAVLLAHAFVAGGQTCDSERKLCLGGIETVACECFQDFTYVALGHLHRPQTLGPLENIRYSGSLLKYSASEIDHRKSVSLVEIDDSGSCRTTEIELKPAREVRRLEGLLEELEKPCPDPERSQDYLFVTLRDKAMPVGSMERLRRYYPNVLDVQLPDLEQVFCGPAAENAAQLRSLDDMQLFEQFFRYASREELSTQEKQLLTGLLAKVAAQEHGEAAK